MIVLVGFMGAGKTTVGQLLAERLQLPFTDTDAVCEQRAGRPVGDVFATEGEEAFRDLEQRAVADVLAGPEAVVALGGGACGRPATREVLAAHTVVHLRVGFEEVLRRIGGDPLRPLLHRPGLRELHAGRAAVYESVASLTVDVDGRSPEEVADEVLARRLGATAAG
ncbi:shikimate kinase [Kineococcus xinjiangensis]|uniref:Shikimate kinase n=1 Tax=Kineococcus xinjiangensis TaxID=512762 RepID=A0A2S6IPB4_9ACTN|nr:shikimate kinase [Kineococcus xinjiangensis]PPK96021.1 shikimate kinase [Kineococcus xinjiangensis]